MIVYNSRLTNTNGNFSIPALIRQHKKNVGEWQEPNLGKSLGVSSLSVSSILHPYTVHTLHDSKTLVNFIHFQNRHGVDWTLDGFGNVSRLVSLNIIFICDQNVFTLNIYISIILGLNRNMFRCTCTSILACCGLPLLHIFLYSYACRFDFSNN